MGATQTEQHTFQFFFFLFFSSLFALHSSVVMKATIPQSLDTPPLIEGYSSRKRRAMKDIAPSEGSASEAVSSKIQTYDLGPLVVENCEKISCRSSSVSHGIISVIGRRRVMEDAVMVAQGILSDVYVDGYDYFAVFDGHGGSKVAERCRDRLLEIVKESMISMRDDGVVDWQKVMKESFKTMDEEIMNCLAEAVEDEYWLPPSSVGSAALVVLVGKEVVVVANCGDSRAVLCRDGGVVPLSRDHKTSRADEKERPKAAGGEGEHVIGFLSSSKSIGDEMPEEYVIAEPEVTIHERTKSEHFLIVASDGLWGVISNEVACEVARWRLYNQTSTTYSDTPDSNRATEAAVLLAEFAIARGSKDNISVIVIELSDHQHTPSRPRPRPLLNF